jgi:spore coat protein U-like protein
LTGRFMRKFLTALLTTGALLGAVGSASAATATTTFAVTATVLKNCTVSALPLAFGNYTPLGGALAVNTTVSVSCTSTTTFNTELTAGATAGSTIAQRLLNDGAGHTLQYNLYTTAGLSTPWGTTIGTNTVAGVGAGMGTPVVQTVYGQLVDSAANQAVPPGAYSDTITVNVVY